MISLWSERLRDHRPAWAPVGRHEPIMPKIVAHVAQEQGVAASDIMGQERRRPITDARNQAYWECRQAGFSTPQIARFFGKLDHTTIINGSRRHAERLLGRRSTDSSPAHVTPLMSRVGGAEYIASHG